MVQPPKTGRPRRANSDQRLLQQLGRQISRLPLPNDLCRCLGRPDTGARVSPTITGTTCERADSCARHQTIAWDFRGAPTPISYLLCEPGGFEHYIEAYAEGQA